MVFPDTEEGVRQMFGGILDMPEVTSAVQLRPGEWRVHFGDGSQLTAYPLVNEFEFDPESEADHFGDQD